MGSDLAWDPWELLENAVEPKRDEALRCLVAREGVKPRWRLLCYGDSLTAGLHSGDLFAPYGETLQLSLDEAADLWICGLCGETAMSLAERMREEEICSVKRRLCGQTWNRSGPGLQRLLEDHGPFDLVLIMAGTNDIGQSMAPDKVVAAIQALHRACHAAGVRTVALSIPPSAASTEEGTGEEREIEQSRREVNRLLQEWAATPEAVHMGAKLFVDMSELMPFDFKSGLWDPDNLHFSQEGSRSLGVKLAPLIRPLLSDCSQACASRDGASVPKDS